MNCPFTWTGMEKALVYVLGRSKSVFWAQVGVQPLPALPALPACTQPPFCLLWTTNVATCVTINPAAMTCAGAHVHTRHDCERVPQQHAYRRVAHPVRFLPA
jgi:hypothetical protein